MYGCPNCSANLKFDIKKQQLCCKHCGTTVDPYDFSKEKDAEEYEATLFTCPQCGAQILSEDTTVATFCSFCGASTILDSRISKEKSPKYILPFTKTKEDCKASYAKMMRWAIFAPNELKDESYIEKFRGIYMPYFIYSFEKKGPVTFYGRKTHRSGDYLITKHYDLDCEIEEEYKGLAYDASSTFSDNLSRAIGPFDTKNSRPFTPAFLSGFYADTSDVDSYTYLNDAQELVIDDGCRCLSNNSVCRRYNVYRDNLNSSLSNAVRPSKTTSELAMFPVWFLSYRNGDRVSYTVINGQTGKAAADLPVDQKKYLIGSALLSLPIFILLNLFFTITPVKILLLAVFLALVCILISNAQLTRIFVREKGEDDKGLASAQNRPTSASADDLANEIADAREHAGKRQKSQSGRQSRVTKVLLTYVIVLFTTFLAFQLLAGVMIRGTSGSIRLGFVPVFEMLVVILIASRFLAKHAGKRSTMKQRYFSHIKEKLPTLIKPLGGILLAIGVLIVNPVSDWFYYFGAFACMGTVLWAIMDIIRQHNLLTMRKLPQLNKRGGDENA